MIATIDNDTSFEPDWLRLMVQALDAGADIGMVAPKVLYMDPVGVIDSAGIDIDRAGFTWNRFNGCLDSDAETSPYEVFGVVTCACLFRRALLDDVGLFDDRFFIYADDPDLCWRAQLRGWRGLYVPAARVYHFHSASMRKTPSLKRYLTSRNRIWSLVKNYHAPDLWLQLPRLVFYDLLSAGSRVLKERSLSPITGRLASLGQLPHFWRERRIVQSSRRVTSTYLNHALAPFPNVIDLIAGRPRRPHRVQR